MLEEAPNRRLLRISERQTLARRGDVFVFRNRNIQFFAHEAFPYFFVISLLGLLLASAAGVLNLSNPELVVGFGEACEPWLPFWALVLVTARFLPVSSECSKSMTSRHAFTLFNVGDEDSVVGSVRYSNRDAIPTTFKQG